MFKVINTTSKVVIFTSMQRQSFIIQPKGFIYVNEEPSIEDKRQYFLMQRGLGLRFEYIKKPIPTVSADKVIEKELLEVETVDVETEGDVVEAVEEVEAAGGLGSVPEVGSNEVAVLDYKEDENLGEIKIRSSSGKGKGKRSYKRKEEV